MRKLNTSSSELYAILSSAGEPVTGLYLWADVRDIELAHVLAIVSLTPSPRPTYL